MNTIVNRLLTEDTLILVLEPGNFEMLRKGFPITVDLKEALRPTGTVTPAVAEDQNSNIRIEITDASEFHCFRLVLNPRGHEPACLAAMAIPDVPCSCGAAGSGTRLEIMFHARALVELIHQSSVALCEWQKQTSAQLILMKTGLSEEEARKAGLIA